MLGYCRLVFLRSGWQKVGEGGLIYISRPDLLVDFPDIKINQRANV